MPFLVELYRGALKDDWDVLLKLATNASADEVLDFIKSFIPLSLGDEVLAALIGYFGTKYTMTKTGWVRRISPVTLALLEEGIEEFLKDTGMTLGALLTGKIKMPVFATT